MFAAVIGISRLHIKATTSYESFAVAKRLKQCVFQEYSQWRVSLYKIETQSYNNWRAFVPKKWSGSIQQTLGQVYCRRNILSTRLGTFQYFRNMSTLPHNVNTKVTNNVMLYRYEKPWTYKIATAFAVVAFVGCLTMADLVYKVLCKGLWVKNKDLMTRLKEHIVPIAAIVTGVVGGPAIAFFVVFVIIRSIKYIILRKGGQEVTIVTYHPYKTEVSKTIPLDNVSSLSTRDGLKAYIPIKVKGTRWNYLLDKSGYFVNASLFDYTVGVKRFD